MNMHLQYKDNQQEVYLYKGRRLSVIDLRVFPASNFTELPQRAIEAYERIMDIAYQEPFEVTDLTAKPMQVLRRFKSGEEAIEFAREYCDKLEKDIQL